MADRSPPHKPVVTSWDVFDTLLARFVPHPHAALQAVEARREGFLARRLEAQAALDRIGKPYVLHDIYRQMQAAGMAAEEAHASLSDELAAERGILLPIRRNLARVDPADLIISDMYLSPEQISDLLFDIGELSTHRPIVRSNWGKHSGTIWPAVLQRYVIRRHVGDNPTADVEVPRKFRIATELVTDSQMTAWEQALEQGGAQRLALIQREVRLRCTPPDPDAFHALVVGPYLTLLAGFAWHLLHRFGPAEYAFVSRSADEAARVFGALHPSLTLRQLDLTRRLTRDAGNDALFAGGITPDTVVVDIVGTGRSFFRFAERSGSTGRCLVFLLLLDSLLTEAERPVTEARRKSGRLAPMFAVGGEGLAHLRLELILQAHYPPVADVGLDTASGGLVRSYVGADLSRGEIGLIGWKSACVTEFVRTIRRRGVADPGPKVAGDLMRQALSAILAEQPQADRTGVPQFASFMAREMQDAG